jgi:hypothetical protein
MWKRRWKVLEIATTLAENTHARTTVKVADDTFETEKCQRRHVISTHTVSQISRATNSVNTAVSLKFPYTR